MLYLMHSTLITNTLGSTYVNSFLNSTKSQKKTYVILFKLRQIELDNVTHTHLERKDKGNKMTNNPSIYDGET